MVRVWIPGAWLTLLVGCVDPDPDPVPGQSETEAGTTTLDTTTSVTPMTSTGLDSSSDGSSSSTVTGVDTTGSTGSTDGTGSTGSTGSSSTDGAVLPAAASDDEYFWVQGPASLDVDDAGGVLDNDLPAAEISVVTSDPLSARGGTVSVEPGGGFTYAAPAGFWGVDSFAYTIEGGDGSQSLATVTVHVRPVLAPVGELPTHEAGFTMLGKTPAELPINVDGLLAGDLRTLGDWDGDGIEDLGVVANFTNLYNEGGAGTDNEGPVYVVRGGPYSGDPTPAALEADMGGFAILPPPSNNGDPATVSSGDFDGDGMRDLAITSPFYLLSGRGYVLYGNQTTTSFALTSWDYVNDGFQLNQFYPALFGIGDLTGDGRDELAFHGCSVILGADQVVGFSGTALPPGVGFSLTGFASCAVEPLHDVDGDGLPELLLHVYDDPFDARAYVMWSQPAPTDTTFDALVAAGDGYYLFDSHALGALGQWRWVSGGGDVDGDGRGDILVDADHALVVAYGKDSVGEQDIEEIWAGVGGFRIETSGVSAGAARIVGDMNGDGRADVLVVRPELDRAYVLYGAPAIERSLPDAAGDGLDGFVIDGMGLGVRIRTTSGDWNGDGLADVAFGALDSLNGRGALHVVYGVRTGP
jgi:hypothetical protein